MLGKLHHVFAWEALSGCYLGHVVDAHGSLCLKAILIFVIFDSWTDKPLWFDGHL